MSGDDLDFASTNPRPVFPQDYYEARARAAQADDLHRALAASIDDAAALRRALAQAEHERDEALAEATRLADILTNCGYWG